MHRLDFLRIAQIVQGFSTPVIAVLLGVITYLFQRRQIRTQEQQAKTLFLQHRLALMKKRMKVFNAVQEFNVLILQEAKLESLQPLAKLMRETREHTFLFGSEIGDYIQELYSKGNRLRTIWAMRTPHQTIRPELIEEETSINIWFNDKIRLTEEKFLKYIDFRDP